MPAATETLTLSNKSKANATLGATYRDANASKRTKAIKIIGNSANNSILGGAGADTLYGGTGRDTLMGGKGKDLFIYDTLLRITQRRAIKFLSARQSPKPK